MCDGCTLHVPVLNRHLKGGTQIAAAPHDSRIHTEAGSAAMAAVIAACCLATIGLILSRYLVRSCVCRFQYISFNYTNISNAKVRGASGAM